MFQWLKIDGLIIMGMDCLVTEFDLYVLFCYLKRQIKFGHEEAIIKFCICVCIGGLQERI